MRAQAVMLFLLSASHIFCYHMVKSLDILLFSVSCSLSLHLFDEKYRTKNMYCEILLKCKMLFCFNVFLNIMYFCASKSSSPRCDPPEISLIC